MVAGYLRTVETMPEHWYVRPLDAEETIAQFLSRLRAERGASEGRQVTQREVAIAIGLEQERHNLINKYETGTIKQPPEEHLEALANYYGVDAEALLLVAYRSSRRRKPEPIPKGSYAVPGDPVLLEHLRLLKKLQVEDVQTLTAQAERLATRPPERGKRPTQEDLG